MIVSLVSKNTSNAGRETSVFSQTMIIKIIILG